MIIRSLDRKFLVMVTAALMLDWVPEYYFGANVGYVSGTKLVAIPLILIHIIIYHKGYLKSYYWIFFSMALIMGVGGGFVLGNVPFERFWELLPTALVLLFYMKPRSDNDVLQILYICFWTSLLVPLTLVLSFAGFFAPSTVSIGTMGKDLFRMHAGPSYSSFGLYTVFVFSALGGILLKKSLRFSMDRIMLSASLVILTFLSIALTGLRSALISSISSVIVSLYLIRDRLNRNLLVVIPTVLILIILIYLMRDQLLDITYTITYRTQMIGEGDQNVIIREQFYKIFFEHISNNLDVVAPGMDIVRNRVGEITHFILGEAYFDGGLIFFIAITVGFLQAGYRQWERYNEQNKSIERVSVNTILISLLVGSFLYLSFQPGLRTRQFYIILGLCLSNGIFSVTTDTKRTNLTCVTMNHQKIE